MFRIRSAIRRMGIFISATSLTIAIVAGMLLSSAALARNEVYIDAIHADDPLQPVDTLYIGGEYCFRIQIENDSLCLGVFLPFLVEGYDGATWEMVDADGFATAPASTGIDFVTGIPGSRWMSGLAPDGSCWDFGGTEVAYDPNASYPLSNQFLVAGASFQSGQYGLAPGPLEPMLEAHFRPGGAWNDGIVGTICIDTFPYPPCSQWGCGPYFDFHGDPFFNVKPAFNLPRCYPVKVLCGDANGNGDVDMFDVVLMVNYVFKGGPPPDPWQLGDANLDGLLNMADVMYLLYAAMRSGPQPQCPENPPTEPLYAPNPPPPTYSDDDPFMQMLCDSLFHTQ